MAFANPLSSSEEKFKAVYNRSIEISTKAIERNPESAGNAVHYFNRGIKYVCAGKFEQARQDLTKAIELDPQYSFSLIPGVLGVSQDEKMANIAFDIFFNAVKDPRHYAWRHAAAEISGKDARFTQMVIPKLKDPSWQVRETAVLFLDKSLGSADNPEVVKSLVPLLRDNAVQVREAVALSLRGKVKAYPQLAGEFINILRTDNNPKIKYIAAHSLKGLNTPEVKEVKPLVTKITAEIKVVVIVPGVYNIIQKKEDIGRDLAQDCTKNWQLRKILELAGIKVIEHRWSGKYDAIHQARENLDNTVLKALHIAGEDNKVMTLTYSAGNLLAERFFSPDLDPLVKKALNENRIHLISIGSPSKYNFGKLDSSWENVWSRNDYISRISEIFTPDKYDVEYNYYPDITKDSQEAHSLYKDPRFIKDMVHRVFPRLDMPQLDKMLKEQDLSKWKYFPTHGSWPGVYNFETVNPKPYIEYKSGHLRDPFVPQSPQIPHQQPIPMSGPQPIHTPQPVYTPERGSWPGKYDFNIRAPDNYYKQPIIMPKTPIMPPTPIIQPPMRR
jgi:tetratricopeptide (TPR) repeat protein